MNKSWAFAGFARSQARNKQLLRDAEPRQQTLTRLEGCGGFAGPRGVELAGITSPSIRQECAIAQAAERRSVALQVVQTLSLLALPYQCCTLCTCGQQAVLLANPSVDSVGSHRIHQASTTASTTFLTQQHGFKV